MNPVVHFEMPFEDRDRAAKFYSTAFGWKPQMMGPEMGETGVGPRRKAGGASGAEAGPSTSPAGEDAWQYLVMQTSETDDKGMIKEIGHINGGMFKKTTDNPHPSIVISVPDIKAAMEKVKAAGGTVSFTENGEPMNIPGIGLYVGITDTEGNRVSMLQPMGM